jgi:hypothetical protein
MRKESLSLENLIARVAFRIRFTVPSGAPNPEPRIPNPE